MGRYINPETAGKERTQISKLILVTLRELARQNEPNREAQDQAAYIALGLAQIAETIDATVGAWEKRGYWVKADRFRLDWAWAEKSSTALRAALLQDDWGSIAQLSVSIAGHLGKIKLPVRQKVEHPWDGAWEKLQLS